MSKLHEHVVKLLNKLDLELTTIDDIDQKFIPRETFLREELYMGVQEELVVIRGMLSSSGMTALHANAGEKQRWPLLNLVRQLLRLWHYAMKPVRRAAGDDKNGKKLYRRYFLIGKMDVAAAAAADADA